MGPLAIGALIGLAIGVYAIFKQFAHVASGKGRWACAYCRAPLVNAYATVCSKCGRQQPPPPKPRG